MDDPGDSGKRWAFLLFLFPSPSLSQHHASFFLSFKIYLFIFGCAGPSLLRARLSLVAATGGSSFLWRTGCSFCVPSCCAVREAHPVAPLVVAHGLLTLWPLLLWSTGSRHMGFSSCSMQTQ